MPLPSAPNVPIIHYEVQRHSTFYSKLLRKDYICCSEEVVIRVISTLFTNKRKKKHVGILFLATFMLYHSSYINKSVTIKQKLFYFEVWHHLLLLPGMHLRRVAVMAGQGAPDRGGDPQGGIPRGGGSHAGHCSPQGPAVHLAGRAQTAGAVRPPQALEKPWPCSALSGLCLTWRWEEDHMRDVQIKLILLSHALARPQWT